MPLYEYTTIYSTVGHLNFLKFGDTVNNSINILCKNAYISVVLYLEVELSHGSVLIDYAFQIGCTNYTSPSMYEISCYCTSLPPLSIISLYSFSHSLL